MLFRKIVFVSLLLNLIIVVFHTAKEATAAPFSVDFTIDWVPDFPEATSSGTVTYDDTNVVGANQFLISTFQIDVAGTIFTEADDTRGAPFPFIQVTGGTVDGIDYSGAVGLEILQLGVGVDASYADFSGGGSFGGGPVTFDSPVPIPEPTSFAFWALASTVLLGGKLCRRRKAESKA